MIASIHNNILRIWRRRPQYATFESMPDWMLFPHFVNSIFQVFYWGYVLAQLWLPFMKVMEIQKFEPLIALCCAIMMICASMFIYFKCVLKRTGGLLYLRWFK